MPYRKPPFITDGYYHLVNRGVAKQPIFLQNEDYERFIWQIFCVTKAKKKNVEDVNVLAYCLMQNHFHLLLQQKTTHGITKYLRRLLIGYSMYFNNKYDRVGSLFQGRTKAKFIQDNSYFAHVSRYIHRNPIEIVKHPEEIKTYPYSSFQFYLEDMRAKGTKLLSFFQNDPKIYERFVLFELQNESPDLLHY